MGGPYNHPAGWLRPKWMADISSKRASLGRLVAQYQTVGKKGIGKESERDKERERRFEAQVATFSDHRR